MNAKSIVIAALCRWTARVIGTLLILLIVMIGIGEGMPNPFTQPPAVQVGFLALALLMIGILAGWRWELTGGVISLAGWCLFFVSVIRLKHLTWFVLALALPGIFYLLSALLRRCKKGQT